MVTITSTVVIILSPSDGITRAWDWHAISATSGTFPGNQDHPGGGSSLLEIKYFVINQQDWFDNQTWREFHVRFLRHIYLSDTKDDKQQVEADWQPIDVHNSWFKEVGEILQECASVYETSSTGLKAAGEYKTYK